MIVIYTKLNCPYCVKAKTFLINKGIEYIETEIGKDISREEFLDTFPNVKSVPHIIIDSTPIGGYNQLVEHFA